MHHRGHIRSPFFSLSVKNAMLTVKGTYKDGRVELDVPITISEPRPVLVTFLEEL
jgi:hypothetical protein